MTRSGGFFIALTLLFGFAAVNTGNNLLYLLVSVFLGFMAMTGLCGHRNLAGLRFKVLPAQELFAQTPGRIRLQVENHHRYLPRFLLKLTMDTGMDMATSLLPAITAGGAEVVSMSVTLPQRGRQTLPSVSVQSGFPVNFFIRSCVFELHQQVLVFPAPLPAELPASDAIHQQVIQIHASLAGGDGDLRNVDAYHPGDSLKAIHWKLSARHQELKTRRFHQQAAPSVILDPERLAGSLEERLGRCTYLVETLSRQGRVVGLRLKDRQIPPGSGRQHRLQLLGALALYE